MKKNLLKISILLAIISIFVVPFSFNIKINNKQLAVKIESNKALAVNTKDMFDRLSRIDVDQIYGTSANFNFWIILDSDNTKCDTCLTATENIIPSAPQTYKMYNNIRDYPTDTRKSFLFEIRKKNVDAGSTPLASLQWTSKDDPKMPLPLKGWTFNGMKPENKFNINTLDWPIQLEPETDYTVSMTIFGGYNNPDVVKTKDFHTPKKSDTDPTIAPVSSSSSSGDDAVESFDCGITKISGCVAQVFYSLWSASSWVAEIGGGFLDFFIYYATNSSSYSNDFVKEGWASIRDIANIFFIIALIYVAIKTILGLNVTDNKKLVGVVVIVALFINFSLFTTQVIIDGSNILAKVFYNSITSKDATAKNADGTLKDSASGNAGQKSISIGIIEKFNPQRIAMETYKQKGLGFFLFITLLLIAVTLYTGYIFFAVAVLFVARVISLWLSMIFAPIAFVSYTLPFEIPGFGHKTWWDNLLKNAFLAPIFIFFLYIIIRFTEFLGHVVTYNDTTSTKEQLLTIIIPFVLIMMLLQQAKKIAVEYSGEMGKAVMGAAKMVGGLALGAATGGTAMLGRATLGRVGEKIASSDWAINRAKQGKFGALNVGNTLSKASFDARGVKIAGKGLSDIGLKNVGKAKEGGYEKMKSDQVAKKQKRAKDLELKENSTLKQNLNNTERDLQGVLNNYSHDLDSLDKQIKAARENAADLNSKETTNPDLVKAKKEAISDASKLPDGAEKTAALAAATAMDVDDPAKVMAKKEANDKVAELKARKKAIKDGDLSFETTYLTDSSLQKGQTKTIYFTDTKDGTGKQNNKTTKGRSINNLETVDIPDAHHEIEKANREIKTAYANKISSDKTYVIQSLLHPFKHSPAADKEAAHKIIMDVKLDSGEKSH